MVLDEFAEVGTPFLADWRLQRYGRLPELEHPAHLGHRNVHLFGNLFRPGLASQFLHQLPRSANQLVDDLDHVHGQADGACLVSNGSADRLANPPRCVGRKLVASAVFELIDRLHQADVAPWIKSRNCSPRLAYLLAIETTRRKLASMSSCLACSASISLWMISRWVRCNCWKLTPASLSSLFRSPRHCRCVLR